MKLGDAGPCLRGSSSASPVGGGTLLWIDPTGTRPSVPQWTLVGFCPILLSESAVTREIRQGDWQSDKRLKPRPGLSMGPP